MGFGAGWVSVPGALGGCSDGVLRNKRDRGRNKRDERNRVFSKDRGALFKNFLSGGLEGEKICKPQSRESGR